MDYRKASLLICSLAFSGTTQVLAQSHYPNAAFISIDGGAYMIPHDHFKKIYGSSMGPVAGFGAGFPISGNLYMYGRLSYFFKEETHKIEMRLIHAGLKYAVPVMQDLSLELIGGFVRGDAKETFINPEGPPSRAEGATVFGLHAGLGLEKRFKSLPISLTVQALQNVSHRDFRKLMGDYDGIGVTIGGRYYLPPPSKRRE